VCWFRSKKVNDQLLSLPTPELKAVLPEFFYRLSPLSMDPFKGPDAQYHAGAKDMLDVLANDPELLTAYLEDRRQESVPKYPVDLGPFE